MGLVTREGLGLLRLCHWGLAGNRIHVDPGGSWVGLLGKVILVEEAGNIEAP